MLQKLLQTPKIITHCLLQSLWYILDNPVTKKINPTFFKIFFKKWKSFVFCHSNGFDGRPLWRHCGGGGLWVRLLLEASKDQRPNHLNPTHSAGPHGTTTLRSFAFNLTLTKMDSGTSNMSQSTTVEKRDKDGNKCERDPIFQNIAQIAQLSYKSLHCRKFPFQNCLC